MKTKTKLQTKRKPILFESIHTVHFVGMSCWQKIQQNLKKPNSNSTFFKAKQQILYNNMLKASSVIFVPKKGKKSSIFPKKLKQS